jgi:hypothetical protein
MVLMTAFTVRLEAQLVAQRRAGNTLRAFGRADRTGASQVTRIRASFTVIHHPPLGWGSEEGALDHLRQFDIQYCHAVKNACLGAIACNPTPMKIGPFLPRKSRWH